MGFLERKFKPDRVYKKAIEVPFEELFKMGYRTALLDMDNTIVGDHAVHPSDYSCRVIEKIKEAGLSCCIVSNARSNRSARLAEMLEIECVSYAGKPSPRGIFQAIDIFSGRKEEVFFLGDQIFTDISAAKNAGIYTIYIEPLEKKEIFYVRIKRPFEKIIRSILRF